MSYRPATYVLALVASMAPTALADFAPPRTFPDTSNRIGVFVDQLPSGMTAAQQQFAAAHYAGTQKLTTNLIDPIRAYNPNFLMLQYRLGVRDSGDSVPFIHNNTWTSDWGQINPHEDWFVHDDQDNRVYQTYGAFKEWIMDAAGLINGNTTNGWKQFWTGATLADIASSHADGVFADSTHLPYAIPVNLQDSHMGPPPHTNYIDDLEGFYDYVYQQYTAANEYFIPNIGNLTTTLDTTNGYYDDVHGAMVEGFATKTSDWAMQSNRELRLLNNDKIWIAQNSLSGAGDIADRKWYLGNYLLLKGRRSYINMFADSQLYWWPEYDLNLGPATDALPSDISAYRLANGLYRRHFQNGYVLVNPTGSDMTYTFISGDPQCLVGISGGGDIDANGNVPADSVTYTLQTTSVLVPAWGAQILMIPQPATLPGDANRDGAVNFADYQILEANFGTGTTWAQGDFNGDHAVTFADYQILETHFGQHVPEPATLSLLALGGLALIRRRRA
jgi:hypothetical protein